MTGSEATPFTGSEAIQSIAAAQRIAVTTHIRPDGDAVGSAVGLFHLLNDNGKQAHLVGLDPIPLKYRFLTDALPLLEAQALQPDDFDLLIVLDTGAVDRAPDFVPKWLPALPSLNIDHHPTNTAFAQTNWINPTASAVAEMMALLARTAKWTISPDAATALWVGITTDTGRFAYSCTTPATLEAGALLLQTGIQTADIDQRVFNTLSLPALRLQAQAIQALEFFFDQRLAIIALSQNDFAACGAQGEDADEIVNIPRKLEGVLVALFLLEQPTNNPDDPPSTKASFRTVPPYDAGTFCQGLGGGGHARAAGCSLALPLQQAREQILSLLETTWFQP